MKKIQQISLCLVITLLFSIKSIEIVAATLDEYKARLEGGNLSIDSIENERVIIETQYNDTLIQMVYTQNQLDKLYFDLAQTERAKEQKVLQEKHLLQVDFFDVCLLIEELGLTKLELEVIDKQIDVESERFRNNDSTQLAVDELTLIKKQIDERIDLLNDSIEFGKNKIKGRLGMEESDVLNISFTISAVVNNSNKYKIRDLHENCKSNYRLLNQNAEYIRLNNLLLSSVAEYSGTDNHQYKSTLAETKKLTTDSLLIERELESYIDSNYSLYVQAIISSKAASEKAHILSKRLEILRVSYDSGAIPEITYLSEKYDIETEKYEGERAKVNLLNAESLLDLSSNGVVIE